MKCAFLAAVAAGLIAWSVQAQELVPLDQAIAGEAEASYPFVRCAGLYLAMAQWVGPEKAGAEAWAGLISGAAGMAAAAAKVRASETGRPEEQVTPAVLGDQDRIAKMYVARFERNYAATGHALAEDQLVDSDTQLCKALATM